MIATRAKKRFLVFESGGAWKNDPAVCAVKHFLYDGIKECGINLVADQSSNLKPAKSVTTDFDSPTKQRESASANVSRITRAPILRCVTNLSDCACQSSVISFVQESSATEYLDRGHRFFEKQMFKEAEVKPYRGLARFLRG